MTTPKEQLIREMTDAYEDGWKSIVLGWEPFRQYRRRSILHRQYLAGRKDAKQAMDSLTLADRKTTRNSKLYDRCSLKAKIREAQDMGFHTYLAHDTLGGAACRAKEIARRIKIHGPWWKRAFDSGVEAAKKALNELTDKEIRP